MLDIKRIRNNPEELERAMKARRSKGADVSGLLELDRERRVILQESEALKAQRNEVSAKIPIMKRNGENTDELMASMKAVAARIKELDEKISSIDEQLDAMLMKIPNIPHASVPDGADDKDNSEVRRVGTPPVFDFDFKPHWDIGEALNILDPKTAGKVTGARFTFYRGLGARLERAVINYFMDTHSANGYVEILPP